MRSKSQASFCQPPLKFTVPLDSGLGEKNRDILHNEVTSEHQISSQGYTIGVFNLLFLFQTKITKQLTGQVLMDEDLFRNYFVKLYKSLNIMETDYLKLLKGKEKKGFT